MANRPQERNKSRTRRAKNPAEFAENKISLPSARNGQSALIHFPIVGIVASAGGLTAFNYFFHAMPAGTGAAFIVVPHLDAKHKSLMVELLSRQTTMPVVEATRILIVDDHPMFREGLRLRISAFPDLAVCGEATTEEEAIELVKESNPGLVIVDISLRCGHGIELIKRIKALAPHVKMLVSSGFQESLYAERALRAGALGYLNKQDSGEKVIDAIRTVLSGERYVSTAITQRLVSQALGNRSESTDPVDLLTDRELELFRMIGSGKTSGAIAEELFLSPHTIDTHRENIKRKLGLKNAAELSRHAVQFLLENS